MKTHPYFSVVLFFCIIQGASSIVYSCEEIGFRLINAGYLTGTKYACIFLEEGLSPSTSYLNEIFIYNQGDSTNHSLSSIASSPSHCVEGRGNWQILSDHRDDLKCDLEITLLMTSDSDTEYVLATSSEVQYRTGNGRVTFVSPHSGMKISVNNIAADLTVYTGAGISNEMLYAYKTWTASEIPHYFASFDNVLTFDTKAKDAIYYVTADYRNLSTLDVGEKAAILTSGKSDNPMDKHPDENYLRYNLLEAATANVHGNLYLDPTYHGTINFTVKGDYMNEERSFTDASIDWKFYASYFEVKYLTSINPEDVWLNQDNFLIEIEMSELPTDITPIPGIRTTEAPDVKSIDNYCNCAITDGWFDNDWDPANIWVDVIIILDTSKSMGASLEEAKSVISSFVGIMSTDVTVEFYSRIGVIAVSDTVEVIYNLNMTSSDDLDNIQQHKIDKIDVGAAFQAALKMFADGTKMTSYRENARQIIYYLTNSAPGANMNGVDDFKTGGGIIIVNDYILEGEVADPGLQKLASDNFFFTDLSENYINSLGVFCEANCFCSPDLHPFNDEDNSPRTQANRGCFHPVNNGIPQQKARETCQKEGAALVSIHDAQKEFFVNGVVSIFGPKKKFWLGYQNDGTQWIWDDKSTDPYTDWDNKQPNTNGGKNMCAYAQQGTGFNTPWTAANCGMGGVVYVCESAPCAAGNKKC
ncbi:hypothetical protein PRIPAC_87508 [Pristionchus pacificus]|uniref:C-type lectin n=1 Tax=Pristionchus pacificus TaxID=54126 RepID=A0A2A6B6I7_PRIPA|nr:hypothetical protein PRIPAC_87508 [Pristionchus pacificus]|eukprot:PDM61492.1 C-type lectin [Pristionchus pacificus]